MRGAERFRDAIDQVRNYVRAYIQQCPSWRDFLGRHGAFDGPYPGSRYPGGVSRAVKVIAKHFRLAADVDSAEDMERAFASLRKSRVPRSYDVVTHTGEFDSTEIRTIAPTDNAKERHRQFQSASKDILELLKVADLIADTDDGPWSTPQSPAEWSKIFKVGPRTFVRWWERGHIRIKRITTKAYQVHLDDLPKLNRGGG